MKYSIRMRILYKYIFAVLLLTGCNTSDKIQDVDYFNGEIKEVSEKECINIDVEWQDLELDGAYYGDVYVHDSIMIFYNTKLNSHFFSAFNIETNEEKGIFCEKGNGPNEAVAYSRMYSFFKENEDLKTLLYAPHNNKICIWNITQSLKQGYTVIKDIPYSWREENNNVFYNDIHYLGNDQLIAKNQSQPIGEYDASSPYYQKRTVSTNEQIKRYDIYKQIIINKDAIIVPSSFYDSKDAIKPDGTKIVMAMRNLPQINIVDLNTGQIYGYRLKGGEDFSIFKTKGNWKIHYQWAHADNKYIYASYLGKSRDKSLREEPETQVIHIFDWEGNLKYKLQLNDAAGHFFVDNIKNRLYKWNYRKDSMHFLDLNTIIQ